MNKPPDLLSLFSAQIKEWLPVVTDILTEIWNFLVDNFGWIELGFLLLTAVFLFGVIIFTKRAKEEFESYKGITVKDALGLGSKRPVEYFEKWETIKRNLKSKKEDKVKKAVIEARHLFDRLLHESLYKGRTFRERLGNFVNTIDFHKRDDLLKAEETAKDLEGGKKEEISYEEASEIIEVYEEAINAVYDVEI